MDREDKIVHATFYGLAALVGGVVFAAMCGNGALGSRGARDEYSFKYQGKPAVVRHEDIRWGPDKRYFLIDGRDKVNGELTSDDGKLIRCVNDEYSVRDAPGYSEKK